MKRLFLAITASAYGLATVPVLAQQVQGPEGGPGRMFGHGHMWGWHPGMVLAPFVMLLALIGAVALIVWLVQWINHTSHQRNQFGCPHCGRQWHGSSSRAALDILESRLARGELGKEEFEATRTLLTR
jgi:uncharacterized membrane protein